MRPIRFLLVDLILEFNSATEQAFFGRLSTWQLILCVCFLAGTADIFNMNSIFKNPVRAERKSGTMLHFTVLSVLPTLPFSPILLCQNIWVERQVSWQALAIGESVYILKVLTETKNAQRIMLNC